MSGLPGIKHLVECHCILPQYKQKTPPVYHKFTVYSKVKKDGSIEKKYAQCNNCNTVHHVIDVCRSELVVGGEDYQTNISIEDMSYQVSDKISNLLSVNNCDYATWEHVLDIIENERWGEQVVIKREVINSRQNVKILSLLSEDKLRIKSKIIEDEIIVGN